MYRRTREVGDGVGDGERGVGALAAHGHVLSEEALRDLSWQKKRRRGGRRLGGLHAISRSSGVWR